MKLLIDTTSNEKIKIGLDDEVFEADARVERAQRLLPFLVEVLKRKDKKLEDIAEINVITGPGSFTGIRVGVSVANTLGWSLKIPVNGKNISVEPTY